MSVNALRPCWTGPSPKATGPTIQRGRRLPRYCPTSPGWRLTIQPRPTKRFRRPWSGSVSPPPGYRPSWPSSSWSSTRQGQAKCGGPLGPRSTGSPRLGRSRRRAAIPDKLSGGVPLEVELQVANQGEGVGVLVGHPVGLAQGASLSGIDWDGVFGGEGERRDASGVLEGGLSGPRRAWSHLST